MKIIGKKRNMGKQNKIKQKEKLKKKKEVQAEFQFCMSHIVNEYCELN